LKIQPIVFSSATVRDSMFEIWKMSIAQRISYERNLRNLGKVLVVEPAAIVSLSPAALKILRELRT
jgi:hypothetical protein